MKKERYLDTLLRFDKQDLVEINGFLGLPRQASKPKKVIAERIVEYVHKNIKWCLYHLPIQDRDILRQMVRAMPNPRVNEGFNEATLTIETLGWIDFAERTDITFAPGESLEYVFIGNHEIIEWVAEVQDEVDNELAERDIVEQAVNGLLNLYGFLSFGDLIDLTSTTLAKTFTRDKVIELLFDYSMVNDEVAQVMEAYQNHDNKSLEQELIVSAYLNNDDFFDNPSLDYYVKHKKFNFNEVIAAGQLPPSLPFAQWKELQDVLCNCLHISQREASFRRIDLWIYINISQQIKTKDMLAIVLATELDDNTPAIDMADPDVARLIATLTEFNNHCPRWYFGGYSSFDRFSEASHTAQPYDNPPIVGNPALPPEVLSIMAGLQMPRPDDPCPCGSGKKYGECCGNN